jgi:NADP-dependent 3-hydroxy acid dehydrogenase YdfG
MKLSGKVAVITGAARGIGRACASVARLSSIRSARPCGLPF